MRSLMQWAAPAAMLAMISAGMTAHAQPVLFVDAAAIGADDGTSWVDAFVDLQDALAVARLPDSGVTEIRVAQGVYRPAINDNSVAFELVNNVRLLGGFAGNTEPDPNIRNSTAFPTVLSGDLNGDDAIVPCVVDDPDCDDFGERCVNGACINNDNTAENTRQVVRTSAANTSSTIIDGFTITGGRAHSGGGTNLFGAGLYNAGGNPTINAVIFVSNNAQDGGGLYNDAGMPRVTNCLFHRNNATIQGGAISTRTQIATLTNNTIVNNRAKFLGGGILTNAAATRITNNIIWDNSDTNGMLQSSQIRLAGGSVPIVNHNCIMNLVGTGGGINNIGADPAFADPAAANYRLPNATPCVNTGSNAPPGGLTPADLDGSVRLIGGTVDMGAYERAGDCNNNGLLDNFDLINVDSIDCAGTGLPDECEIRFDSTAPGGPFYCVQNCNPDCNVNGIPDDCEPDCNNNNIPDDCDIAGEFSEDCNGDGVPDECSPDCNQNDTPDVCDIFNSTSRDCNDNATPDECEISMEAPGGPFFCTENCDPDCNANNVPDDCELEDDCNANLIPDDCDIEDGTTIDCNKNGLPDPCEIARGSNAPNGPFFCDANCDPDCTNNGIPDDCEIDCNHNAVPDICDLADGTSTDCDNNNVPDDCQTDSDGDGVINVCDNCPGTAAGVPVRSDGCPQVGACCFPGNCIPNQAADACLGFNGSFLGDLLTCTGDPDGDQVVGCNDGCPLDATKTSPGICGCGVPDNVQGGSLGDCNQNGRADICDISLGLSADCNLNGLLDECDLSLGFSFDCNDNGRLDECEIPKGHKAPGGPFFCIQDCDPDCNHNGILDECDLLDDSEDCDGDNQPDECQTDTDKDGIIDPCDACTGDDALLGQPCDSPDDLDPCRNGLYECTTKVIQCTDDSLIDDADGDGIFDCHDFCPGTPPDTPVDVIGCPFSGGCCSANGSACFNDISSSFCNDVLGGFYLGNGSTCPAVCVLPGDGDCDGDSDVDVDDFEFVVTCTLDLAGAAVTTECRCADMNADNVLDVADWGLHQAAADRCAIGCPRCRKIPALFGDCCNPAGNGSPGCNAADVEQPFTCCEAVCGVNPFCCAFDWSDNCATIAREQFPVECNCPELPQACCFPGNICQNITPTECVNFGGTVMPDELCGTDANFNNIDDACEAGCPEEAFGDCCDALGLGVSGCGNETCCDVVCALKPECCFANWDASCALLAGDFPTECACPTEGCCMTDGSCLDLPAANCSADGGFTQPGTACFGNNDEDPRDDLCQVPCPPNANDCCEIGAGGFAGCNDPTCCDEVCFNDLSCCLGEWDAGCVALAESIGSCGCGLQGCCFGDGSCQELSQTACIDAGGTPSGLGTVCLGDNDLNGVDDLCDACGPKAGDCCDPDGNGSPGCNDSTCCESVCDLEPSCCEFEWDSNCAILASDVFSGLCLDLCQ